MGLADRTAVVIDCSADCLAEHCSLGRASLDLLAQRGVQRVHLAGRFEAPSPESVRTAESVSLASGTLEPGPVFLDAFDGQVSVRRASKLVIDFTQVRRGAPPSF